MRKISAEKFDINTSHLTGLKINNFTISVRRATRGKEGGGLPCPFLKIKKSALILEKMP